MPDTAEVREQLRATDGSKIARTWTSSPWLDSGDSKNRVRNPEQHRPICQREDGKYTDVEGNVLKLSEVPAYIRELGKPQSAAPPPSPRTVQLDELMQETGAAVVREDAPAPRAPARRRGRSKK
jgi:hypothetical protein